MSIILKRNQIGRIKMLKKTPFMIFALLFSLSFSTIPDDIDIQFDSMENVLIISIPHYTDDPSKHFINTISVLVNGDTLIKQRFLKQYSHEMQQGIYKIAGLKAGDEITVDAHCNKWGGLTMKFKVVRINKSGCKGKNCGLTIVKKRVKNEN